MRRDYWYMAAYNVSQRGVRSWLTMVGIFIGVAAIVGLMSLSQGLSGAVQEQFEEVGVDKLFIQPKGGFGPPGSDTSAPLASREVDIVERVRGVDEASGFLNGAGKVQVDDTTQFVFVAGIPTGEGNQLVREAYTFDIGVGRELRSRDRFQAVLGIDYRQNQVLGERLQLRDSIQVNGERVRVVGFWERIGNPSDDRSVTIPKETFRQIFDQPNTEDVVIARIDSGTDIRDVAERIERELRQHRGQEEGKEDFVVETPEEVLSSFTAILDIVQIALIGIASISVIVGGVGITNTMYTAVLERTREIGIMKAVGARNSDILSLFMLESAFLGTIGGIVGASVGIGFAVGVESIVAKGFNITLVQAYTGLDLIIGAVAFAAILGTFAGLFPARNAAQLQPAVAVRQ